MRVADRALAALAVAGALAGITAAGAAGEPRTSLVSGAPALLGNGASSAPALSGDGSTVVFASTATNLGGLVPGAGLGSIYARSRTTGRLRLVSSPDPSIAADGASSEPSVSGNGAVVAWTSSATNLVPGDANGHEDVFARVGDGPIVLVSASAAGGPADGDSAQSAISDDGRYVAFTSTADDLLATDPNGRTADVFIRDLVTSQTKVVSVSSNGAAGNGTSSQPSISKDGVVVSFSSVANNLVDDDGNNTGDVFARVVPTGRTQRISLGRGRTEQNLSVAGPFPQVSSVSADGRYVAFDSDANNLVRGDVNKHTDVFVRDRKAQTTVLASLSSGNVQGNSDSFFPELSGDGRFVSFESFASNLVPGDPVREDIFLRDLRLQATSLVDVSGAGAPRDAESVAQLLQRPQVSQDGEIVAFVSTAGNLASGDINGVSDVFARRLTAARTSPPRLITPGRRPAFRLASTNPRATAFLCRIDGGAVTTCRSGTWRPRARLAPGRHILVVRAGGPGLKFDALADAAVHRALTRKMSTVRGAAQGG